VIIKGKLEQNQHLIAALRDALLDRAELVGHEITDVLTAAQAAGPRPAVIDLREPSEVLATDS
jgi:hypothetical protein